MKKILLFAGAALTCGTAMAGLPQQSVSMDGLTVSKEARAQVKVERKDVNLRVTPSMTAKLMTASDKVIRRADEQTPAADAFQCRYLVPPMYTLYAGMTPAGMTFPMAAEDGKTSVTFGVSGNYGVLPFLNMSTGATSYEWNYSVLLPDSKEFLDQTYKEENLIIRVTKPWTQIKTPTLSALNATERGSFTTPYVGQFLFCPSLASFGLAPSYLFSDYNEATDGPDYYGLTTCPINTRLEGTTWLSEAAVMKNPAESDKDYYNEQGTCVLWQTLLQRRFQETHDVSNVRVAKYFGMIPEQNQPYLIDQMWCGLVYSSTADVTLKVSVCPVIDETIYTNEPYGTGELILPASPKQTADRFVINLESVDEEGFPTSNPLAIYGEVAVVLEGFDDEAITMFAPNFNAGTEIPEDADINDYYFLNASIGISFDTTPKGDPEGKTESAMILYPTGLLNYDLPNSENLYYPTDLDWCYNILFPFVLNEEEGTTLNVNAPAEGGDVDYNLYAYYNISDLMEEGLMTVETENCDWFTYSLEVVDEELANGETAPVDQLQIKAQALPEGEKGRYGVIKFRGFAQDCNVYVGQGEYEISGIESVVAAGKGAAEYFDLQGRKLSAAPSHGVYIVREGNKVSKRVAR